MRFICFIRQQIALDAAPSTMTATIGFDVQSEEFYEFEFMNT